LIYLFILEANNEDHLHIFLGLLLSVLVAYIAFFGNWISLDATKAVVIFGTIIFGLGGWSLAVAVLMFFITSNLLTRWNRVQREKYSGKKYRKSGNSKRRDGYQIWANGFWIALFCILWYITGSEALMVASFTALATATADTWATEVGTVRPGKTVKINTLQPVRPGSDGGVSVKGTIASALGALLISGIIFTTDTVSPFFLFIIVFQFGFIGSIIDSYLGALITDNRIRLKAPSDFSGNSLMFSNSFVNWASTGTSALIALIITNLII
tara:strand:- start:58860 stop:59666 length:807 start_codon:yes stop_codon:yes gene_type:complete